LSVCTDLHFSYTSHQLHFHSFPTRRSSDLQQAQKRHGEKCRRCSAQQHEGCSRHESRNGNVISPLQRSVGAAISRCHSGSRREQDRKSTRLNSSHVSISYAVFCLKKKII